ncbi:Uncharacterised protein [uncultured archaeon]|nr:Uncharacterised protein [uncultured archaeon]
MKRVFSSVDVLALVSELDGRLSGARIEKVYQLGEKDVVFSFRRGGVGRIDLLATSQFAFVTGSHPEVPREASNFAMKLRKHLTGGFIRGVRQHGFDRIIEFDVEAGPEKYTLVFEFFSRGNIFLLDSDGVIKALLEWQKWRDRVLGVNQPYKHPPEAPNPLTLPPEGVSKGLTSSQKKAAAYLATDVGLGPFWAEDVCLKANVDREKKGSDLSAEERERLINSFVGLMQELRGPYKPYVVFRDGKPFDSLPYPAAAYESFEKDYTESFSEALDVLFGSDAWGAASREDDAASSAKRKKLTDLLESQKNALAQAGKDALEWKKLGDAVYANYAQLEELFQMIRKLRAEGQSDEEITKRLASNRLFRNLSKTEVTVVFEED